MPGERIQSLEQEELPPATMKNLRNSIVQYLAPRRLEHINYWVGTGILAVLILLFFGNSLGCYFAQEDFYAFKHSITSFSQLREIFFPAGPVYSYRPLATLYFSVVKQYFGYNPAAYHLMNLLVHISLVAVIHKLGRVLFGATIGFLSALFFAFRGVNFLPVYWVVNITQSLPVLTVSGALLAFVLFIQRRNRFYYFLSAFLCVVSFLLHEMAIFLPFMMSIYLLFVDESGERKKAAIAHIPFYVITVAYLALRLRSSGVPNVVQQSANSHFILASVERLFLLWNLCFNVGEIIVLSLSPPKKLSLHFFNYLFQGVLVAAAFGAVVLMKVRKCHRQDIRRYVKWLIFCISFSLAPLVLVDTFLFVRPYRLNLAAVGACFLSAILATKFFRRNWIAVPVVGYLLISIFCFWLIRRTDYESIMKRQAIARTVIQDMEGILERNPYVSSVRIVRYDDWNIFPAIQEGDAFETVLSAPVSLTDEPPKDKEELQRFLNLVYKDGHLWGPY